MTDLEKPKPKATRKKKPPTQTAGVEGFVAFETKPDEPFQQYIDWRKLTALPAFEMFVQEQSGFSNGSNADEWMADRRAAIGDDKLYGLYAQWHSDKGYWVNETPVGNLINSNNKER